MKPVYIDSTEAEKTCKAHFFFPECVMMENAAAALEKEVLAHKEVVAGKTCCDFNVLIVCGGGNNGADGLTLARRLVGQTEVTVILVKAPSTLEAQIQYKMASACGVQISNKKDALKNIHSKNWSVVVDCLYGTGFRGELSDESRELIQELNDLDSYKIACDIPSALTFKADKTVTMGALKTILFCDRAKDFTGQIVVADLGLTSSKFCSLISPDGYLLEKEDIVLPLREKQNVHKGNFGHSSVIIGNAPGAGIIAATAALKAGAGYSTAVTGYSANCQQFYMNPELLQNKEIPAKTTAILLGSGLGRDFESPETKLAIQDTLSFLREYPKTAVVLDADIFYSPDIKRILKDLSESDTQVILTPHPKELHQLLQSCTSSEWNMETVLENRFEVARMFSQVYPNLVLVSKGANTFITTGSGCYIFDKGSAALAKAGSGDVLAGLCTGLLAQGYQALTAAQTAVWIHGTALESMEYNFMASPLELIQKL